MIFKHVCSIICSSFSCKSFIKEKKQKQNKSLTFLKDNLKYHGSIIQFSGGLKRLQHTLKPVSSNPQDFDYLVLVCLIRVGAKFYWTAFLDEANVHNMGFRYGPQNCSQVPCWPYLNFPRYNSVRDM